VTIVVSADQLCRDSYFSTGLHNGSFYDRVNVQFAGDHWKRLTSTPFVRKRLVNRSS
jgi:hypothetical protein